MKANRITPEVTQVASNCHGNISEYDAFVEDKRNSLLDRRNELMNRLSEMFKETAMRFRSFHGGGIIHPHRENPYVPSGEYIVPIATDSSDDLYFQYWKELRGSRYILCDGEWVWRND